MGRQGRGIPGLEEQARTPVLDDVDDASRPGADARQAAGGRLDQRDAQRLELRCKSEHV